MSPASRVSVLSRFLGTYCLPCREKFPRTLALAKKYADQGLTAVLDEHGQSRSVVSEKFISLDAAEFPDKNFADRLEDTDAAFGALDIAGGALPHYKIYGRTGSSETSSAATPTTRLMRLTSRKRSSLL